MTFLLLGNILQLVARQNHTDVQELWKWESQNVSDGLLLLYSRKSPIKMPSRITKKFIVRVFATFEPSGYLTKDLMDDPVEWRTSFVVASDLVGKTFPGRGKVRRVVKCFSKTGEWVGVIFNSGIIVPASMEKEWLWKLEEARKQKERNGTVRD